MINSKKLLKKPSVTVPRFFVVLLILLAIVGLGVSTYLTVEHLRGSLPNCSITGGCESVLTSKYATIGPVPTASFGVVYYLVIIISGALYLDVGNILIMRLVGWLMVAGFVVSLYLVYLQLWVIGAICLYCMTSALVSTLLFIIDLVIWRKYLRIKEDRNVEQGNVAKSGLV